MRTTRLDGSILVANDLALILILVLQAYYLVDLIGGVCVALLAAAFFFFSFA